jgi:hypothetical protein
MIAAATVTDYQGYLNWPGNETSQYAAVPIYYYCNDVESGRALTRIFVLRVELI